QEHCLLGRARRGEDLRRMAPAAVLQHHVGERAADVGGKAGRLCAALHAATNILQAWRQFWAAARTVTAWWRTGRSCPRAGNSGTRRRLPATARTASTCLTAANTR